MSATVLVSRVAPFACTGIPSPERVAYNNEVEPLENNHHLLTQKPVRAQSASPKNASSICHLPFICENPLNPENLRSILRYGWLEGPKA